MAAYFITDADWTDVSPETIQQFSQAARPVIISFGGKFLTVPQTPEVLEGNWSPKHIMVVEFPDAAAIRQMRETPEFKEAVAIRTQAGAVFKSIVVEGAPA